MTVFQFVEWEPEFKGSATQLLKELNLKASELGIQTDKFWPKAPGALSRKLNLIRTSLRRIGVDIELLQHQGKEGKSREIRVCKLPSEASVSTVTSDISPNQTRIKFDASDDITDDSNKIPTEKLAQNYAQNGTSDDTDNSDDTFHIISPLALTSNSYQQQPSYNNRNEKASSGETAGAHSSLIPSSQQTMTNDSSDISQENSTNNVNNVIESNERPSSIPIKPSEPSANVESTAIVSVEWFFHDVADLPYQPLPEHLLEQSPCYAIIHRNNNGLYFCRLHPEVKNVNLDSIEHHCKYKDPDIFEEALRLMSPLLPSSMTTPLDHKLFD
jgi:hypothetical protein